jgi:hypothetical protein
MHPGGYCIPSIYPISPDFLAPGKAKLKEVASLEKY